MPEIDTNAPGWGPNGEYTIFQNIMAVLGGVGWLVALVGVIVGIFAPQVGQPMFFIGAGLGTLFLGLGGFLK